MLLKQLRLLLWKSARTAGRSPIWTLLEIGLPLVVYIILRKATNEARPKNIPDTFYKIFSSSPMNFDQARDWTYQCEDWPCEELTAALRKFCPWCAPRNSETYMNAFNGTRIDATLFDGELFSNRMRLSWSSDEFSPFSRHPHTLANIENMIGHLTTRIANLTIPIEYFTLARPRIRTHKEYPFMLDYHQFLAVFMLIPLLAAVNVVRDVASEKESKMKDYLLVMGMSRAMYYVHHLIWGSIKTLLVVILVSTLIIGSAPSLGLHFLVAFALFTVATLSLATVIPAFIKKPTVAVLTTLVLIPFDSIIAVTFSGLRNNILLSFLTSISPGHAMLYAYDAIREGALRNHYVNWFTDARYIFTYGQAIAMMIFDIVFFIALAILVDVVGGSTENLFARCKRVLKTRDDEDELFDINVHEEDPSLENVPVDVELLDVHKTYPSGECAVRGISMKLHRGQVTVLLGHNGAGKSTTFDMIAGITQPTAGSIRIGSGSKDAQQSMIGYCPQYNPIFPKLTVQEHLDFFAGLKGRTAKTEVEGESQHLLKLLELTEKRNTNAVSLSGGMKRKLCIAISLIGNSQVVLLDEPTAGVDTGARRDIERLLDAQRKERTLLLTTHYTDEAEHLGDRIMIMAGGKLVCSGSPHFLHRNFGAGYVLSCVAKDSKDLAETTERTLRIAEDIVEVVKLERHHGSQFDIWMDKERSETFPQLFQQLEERKDELGIASYGLNNNTLEQVFLKVGEITGVTRKAKVKEAMEVLLRENEHRSTGPVRLLKSFFVLQYKRFFYELSEIRSILLNLLPLFLFVLCAARTMALLSGQTPASLDKIEIPQELNLMKLPQCARVAVSPSLNITEKLRAHFGGDCMVVDETEAFSVYEYAERLNRRPPLLATIENMQGGRIVVHVSPNVDIGVLPLHVALVSALTNTEFEIHANYKKRPVQQLRYRNYERRSPETSESFVNIGVAMLMFIQPILVYRSIGFYVVERAVKFAHQQSLTGLPVWMYWLSSFVSDAALFSINLAVTVVCSWYFEFLGGEWMKLIPLCYMIFCVSVLKCYIMQRFFESKSKAENLIVVLLTISCIASLAVFLSRKFKAAAEQRAGSRDEFHLASDYALLLDPQLSVAAHYFKVSLNTVPKVYYALLVQICALLLIFSLLECRSLINAIRRVVTCKHQIVADDAKPLLDGDNSVLEVHNLVKSFGDTPAVNNISFNVQQHECFGLLGINGAGKTTTFEVLTGNTYPSSGSASVAGVDCATPAQIGYCPQFDALMAELTGKQNLTVLAALHGYRNPRLVADTVIDCVGMKAHANKKSKSYSGGQRRKISVAGAMLAQSSLIILDEPTAGIDPVTRRDIWSVICALRDFTDTAVLLTSHSMEEVEALCSRIAILRTGQIVAAGTSQSLKSAYGLKYKLSLVVDDKSPEEVLSLVRTSFPEAKPSSGVSGRVHTFEIPRVNNVKWSVMFSKAIGVAKQLETTDYCMTQATLEDAFITLSQGSDNDAQFTSL